MTVLYTPESHIDTVDSRQPASPRYPVNLALVFQFQRLSCCLSSHTCCDMLDPWAVIYDVSGRILVLAHLICRYVALILPL
jgi:hypothetical protein